MNGAKKNQNHTERNWKKKKTLQQFDGRNDRFSGPKKISVRGGNRPVRFTRVNLTKQIDSLYARFVQSK